MDSTVVDKCLAFCQTLATSNMQFKFNLSFGQDIFNFEIKELAKSSCIKKKKTPSQIRREERRREEVKINYSEKNSEATDKVAQESADNTVHEMMTEDSHKAVADGIANIISGPQSEANVNNC